MNKCGKFCVKILLHYTDIAIFALGYFILPHPVYGMAVLPVVTPTKSNQQILYIVSTKKTKPENFSHNFAGWAK